MSTHHEHNTQSGMQSGFSLLEMGIVLIIIGLIVGGVFVGQSMIRTSQIRAIINDMDRYIKAVDAFQQKYFALPGDMSTAESFWGSDAGCPSVATNIVKKQETCNGTGDGRIGLNGTSNQYEMFRAWQQLANAGMVGGGYTGVSGASGSAHAVIDQNVPRASLTGAGYTLLYWGVTAGDADNFATEPGHILAFGAATTTSYTTDPALSPVEAYEIDNKVDDGRPAYGKVKGYKPVTLNPNCVTSSTASTATYDMTRSSLDCALIFSTGY